MQCGITAVAQGATTTVTSRAQSPPCCSRERTGKQAGLQKASANGLQCAPPIANVSNLGMFNSDSFTGDTGSNKNAQVVAKAARPISPNALSADVRAS